MEMINGQMSIFDLMKEPEPDVIYPSGMLVWMVIRGDIEPYIIAEEKPWFHNKEVIYRLKHNNGTWWTMRTSEIGNIFFLDYESALKKSGVYFAEHPDAILADQIQPVETKSYSYIRTCDGREMFSFYAVLPDGKVYVKEFMSYEHIVDFGSVEKALKAMCQGFTKQQAFEYARPQEINVIPIFKNMYRCRDDDKWLYAEAKYGRCI